MFSLNVCLFWQDLEAAVLALRSLKAQVPIVRYWALLFYVIKLILDVYWRYSRTALRLFRRKWMRNWVRRAPSSQRSVLKPLSTMVPSRGPEHVYLWPCALSLSWLNLSQTGISRVSTISHLILANAMSFSIEFKRLSYEVSDYKVFMCSQFTE